VSAGRGRARRFAAHVAGLSVVLWLGLAAPAPTAAADWADWGTATADATYLGGIDFRQRVTLDRPVSRVELLLTVANADGPTVIPVPVPNGIGATQLAYHFDPAVDGHLYPNAILVAHWRLTSLDDPTAVSVGPALRLTVEDERFTWQTVSGDLVTVHWYEGPRSFGERALRIAEDAVRDATSLLGVTESDPIDFTIYADQDAFYDALGPATRENVGGAQIPGLRTLFALIPPDQINDAWVGTVVPHELTHLVFETAADNPYHFPPNWLNEGLAVYESEGYGSDDRARVRDAVRAGSLLPLDGLIGQFPTNEDGFRLAYAASVSAVDYMVRTHGTKAVVSLIRSYAQGRTDDEAFTAALGVDLTAFGAAWLDDLGAAAPTRFGPQPAPAGPVPAAWLAAPGATAGPAASGEAPAGPSPSPTAAAPAGESGGTLVIALLVASLVLALIVVGLAVRRRRTGPGAVG
jgi:hypothetical protein